MAIAGVNILLFGAVFYMVLAPSTPLQSNTTRSAAVSGVFNSQEFNALDQLASASIAQTVATMTGVDEATAITNQADTERANLDQASFNDDSLAFKPQVIESAYKSNKDIRLYVVQSGDTVAKIAEKFDVSSDSIRWSNNLSGNSVTKGKKLRIPPVEGMVYIVKAGDTTKSLALRYNISEAKIIQYNDAELHGIKKGEVIILPGASKAAQIARTASIQRRPSYGNNGYAYGYCTWWVAELRARAGNPIPNRLGDASSWPYWSKKYGLSTGTTPRVGAAVVTQFSGQGHVAYVTAVKGSNTITISEMNINGNWNVTDTRTISGNFFYIY